MYILKSFANQTYITENSIWFADFLQFNNNDIQDIFRQTSMTELHQNRKPEEKFKKIVLQQVRIYEIIFKLIGNPGCDRLTMTAFNCITYDNMLYIVGKAVLIFNDQNIRNQVSGVALSEDTSWEYVKDFTRSIQGDLLWGLRNKLSPDQQKHFNINEIGHSFKDRVRTNQISAVLKPIMRKLHKSHITNLDINSPSPDSDVDMKEKKAKKRNDINIQVAIPDVDMKDQNEEQNQNVITDIHNPNPEINIDHSIQNPDPEDIQMKHGNDDDVQIEDTDSKQAMADDVDDVDDDDTPLEGITPFGNENNPFLATVKEEIKKTLEQWTCLFSFENDQINDSNVNWVYRDRIAVDRDSTTRIIAWITNTIQTLDNQAAGDKITKAKNKSEITNWKTKLEFFR